MVSFGISLKSRQVNVTGIGYSNERDIANLFSKFGNIAGVRLFSSPENYAIVSFADVSDIEKVLRAGQLFLKGRKLKISKSDEDVKSVLPRHFKSDIKDSKHFFHLNKIEDMDQLQNKKIANESKGQQTLAESSSRRFNSPQTGAANNTGKESYRFRFPKKENKASHSYRNNRGRSFPNVNDLRQKLPLESNYLGSKKESFQNIFETPTKVQPSSYSASTPVYVRSFNQPQKLQNVDDKPETLNLPSCLNGIYPCSPQQPLPLVFPVYQTDKYYMSMKPLEPSYFLEVNMNAPCPTSGNDY